MTPTLPAALLLQLEAHALGLPGALLDIKWGGVRVFQVEGKMFGLISGDKLSFKTGADDFLALSGQPGILPAPYLARARWVQVHSLQSLDAAALAARLAAAHHLVLARLPKATRARYGL